MVRTPDRPIDASLEASNDHHPGRGAGGGLAPDRLARALQLIEESHGATLLVADIARHVNMSPFHFARMFKLSTGYSPHSYLTVRRIERAKGMLERTSVPLAEIARAVGFATQAHFTGVFRSRTGTTPRAYRVGSRHAPAAHLQDPGDRPSL